MVDSGTRKEMLVDADLVHMARNGDTEAFGELVLRHRKKCVDLATFFLRNHGDAEDEAQNAISQACRHLDQYEGEAEFSTWLSRIVVNQCLMLMRGRRRAKLVFLDEPAPGDSPRMMEAPADGPDPEGEIAHSQMISLLKREVRRLPPMLRNVMVLRDLEELPMTEVAEQLGITVPAAKSRLIRARTELRSRLSQYYESGSLPFSRSAAPLERVGHHCAIRLQ